MDFSLFENRFKRVRKWLFDFQEGMIYKFVKSRKEWQLIDYSDKKGYKRIKINSEHFLQHRVLYKYFHNIEDMGGLIVDHIDKNRINNCINNLRLITHNGNRANCNSAKNSSSKYVGISWHKNTKKWLARVGINKRKINLGSFLTEEQAALARDQYIIDNNLEYHTLNILRC